MFVKTASNKRPPVAKKIPQWFINLSLETIKFKFHNPSNKTNLLLKTLFLVAFFTGNIASELRSLRRNNINFSGICNKVTNPVKKVSLGKKQTVTRMSPPISFEGLGPRHPFCPITFLKNYLNFTKMILIVTLFLLVRKLTHPCSEDLLTSGWPKP